MSTAKKQTPERVIGRIQACIVEAGLPDDIEELLQETLGFTINLSRESHRTVSKRPTLKVYASVASLRNTLQPLLPAGELLPYIVKMANVNQWRVGWLQTRKAESFSASRVQVRPRSGKTHAVRNGKRTLVSLRA